MGRDMLCSWNCPAQSKFNLIDNCPIPTSGQSLFSFIGLVNFCHRFAPYLEIHLNPPRKLVKKFHHRLIPSSAWTDESSKFFTDLKKCISSSPVLARFEPSEITFLKTDWSSKGMGWILMQPTDDKEPVTANIHLLKTCI